MFKKTIVFICSLIVCFCCKQQPESDKHEQLTFIEKVKAIPDSITVQGITIKNLFKYQVLAHEDGQYNEALIVNKVYKAHQKLWDSCYAMVYGAEQSSKFNTPEGMVAWNKRLYLDNKAFFNARIERLLEANLDSVVRNNLKRFQTQVPREVSARISIVFSPLIGIGFGGCNKEQFCVELNDKKQDIEYTIEKGMPHELNHFAYEPTLDIDPLFGKAIARTIDEGFACYFTWVFFNGNMPKHEAVENMTKAEWNWYLAHEKEIFKAVEQYFQDANGDNPLLKNDKFKLFEDAPGTLFYWLGFRIVEKYVEQHGEDSWKDIYDMRIRDVLHNSKYKEYLSKIED